MQTPVILEYRSPAEPFDHPMHQGKFLQLMWRGQEYLIFAPSGLHRYHNQILAHFLTDNTISHRWVTQERLEFAHPALVVIGGGRFRVSTEEKTLALWDDSQAYGRFQAPGLADKIAAAGHPWSRFTIRVS